MQGMALANRAVALATAGLLMSAPVAGQTAEQSAAPTEAQLLVRIQVDPAGVAAYLDLAKLYIEQGRLDEAYELMARGLAVVSEARQAKAAAGRVNAPPMSAPVRLGGDIPEPRKIRDVRPVYPQIAQNAKVQGAVVFDIIVGKDGDVVDAKVLESVPLLDQSAMDAVLQWRYTPTLLNGIPVEVIMTVTVNFTLSGGLR